MIKSSTTPAVHLSLVESSEAPGMADGHADLLLRAARALSSARRETIFDDLTRAVTDLLGCDVGLLGLSVDSGDEPSVEILSCYADGAYTPRSTYPVAGTPCETVIGQEFRFYPRDVGYLFPNAGGDQRVEGYAAYPLFDPSHRPMGILTVMSYREIEDGGRVESLLRIFAERAVAEIERAAAEDALRASEEQYRAIFNSSVDGVALLKPDGEVVDVNPAIEQLYGFSREELIGHNAFEFLDPDHRKNAEQFIKDVLARGYGRIEDRAIRKDGSIFYSEPRGVTMDYQGELHVLTFVRDISSTKHKQQALRQSEDLLRATVEAGLDCIISMDQEGYVLDFNPAAERCFGYSKDEAAGRMLSSLIIPERFRTAHHEGLKRYLEGGDGPYVGKRMEVTAMRADGTEFPVELAIGIATGAHRKKIFIGYLRDITERREAEYQRQMLEGQLRQAQKMEVIGHLTGGVAHDFNNILTSVLGYVELAAERVKGGDDEKLSRYLVRAQRSGERARELIQQMLTFSRGQQGEPRSINLKPVIEEGLSLLEATMPSTIQIEPRLVSTLPTAKLDPVHVEQVLVNLCINARDAMNGVGTLAIELAHPPRKEHICASCHQPVAGDFIEFSVGDSGPGISEQLVNRIFEPFFSTKEVGKGSGMGLATVHGIVHEYGGHIIVNSEVGHGTKFRVLLPAEAGTADAEPAAHVNERKTDPDALHGRVLIVDDNIAVAEFLDELLTSWGLDVVPFADGAKALNHFLANTATYDLLVTDQTMPNITGMQLAGQVLRARPDLPVILYTGYSEDVTEQAVRDAGIHALVKKPLDIPKFRALVEDIFAASP